MKSKRDVFRLRERDVSRQVQDFLKFRQWRVLRNNVTKVKDYTGRWTSYGEPGMADLTAIHYCPDARPGAAALMWIETKAPGGKLRAHQAVWHRDELIRGGLVVVANNIEDFERWYWETFAWLHTEGQGQGHLFQQRQG